MNHNSRLLRTLFTAVVGGALLFGCDDDDDADVVLPDGEVITFTDVDTDGDAYVSADEWNDFYDEWDIDGDGEIENDEWALAASFDDVDIDGDGVVDEEEYSDAFAVLDEDTDGLLAPDELILE